MPPTDFDMESAKTVLAGMDDFCPDLPNGVWNSINYHFGHALAEIERLTRRASEDVEAAVDGLEMARAAMQCDGLYGDEAIDVGIVTLRRLDAENARLTDIAGERYSINAALAKENRELKAELARRDRVDAEKRARIEAFPITWKFGDLYRRGQVDRRREALAILDAQPTEPRTPDTNEQPDYGRGPDYSHCMSAKDGECNWRHCPQLRDNEPFATGRHCPLDNWSTDNE